MKQPSNKQTLLSYHSHKKRKDSLDRSLDWVLFATEPEFIKILVPRLPKNTSDINVECAGKSKQLYSLCYQHWSTVVSSLCCSDICFQLIMLGVNYAIYYSPFWRQVQQYHHVEVTPEEKQHCCTYYKRYYTRVVLCRLVNYSY